MVRTGEQRARAPSNAYGACERTLLTAVGVVAKDDDVENPDKLDVDADAGMSEDYLGVALAAESSQKFRGPSPSPLWPASVRPKTP